MKKLTKEQKKIIYFSIAALVSLLLFWLFIYLPQKRRYENIKNKIAATEAEIAQIDNLIQGKPLQEAVKDLNSQLNGLVASLPSGEEEVLKNLSELAKKLKLEIQQVTLSDKQALTQVAGLNIKELPVSMKLSGEYRDLGEYLYILKNNFPVLTRVKRLEIQGSGEVQRNLNINLNLSAYLSE